MKLGYRLIVVGLVAIVLLCAACARTPTPLSIPGVTRIDHYDDWPRPSNPAWSPDGSRLVVDVPASGLRHQSKVYVLDVASGDMQLLLETDNGFRHVQDWSPLGDEIAVSASPVRVGDSSRIWLINVDGSGEPRSLIDGYRAAWSPTGEEMAVVQTDRQAASQWTHSLWILDLRTGEGWLMASWSAERIEVNAVSWSPDGRHLAFDLGLGLADESVRMDIYILDLTTGDSVRFAPDGDNCYPTWSPDGRWLAYVSRGEQGRDTIMIARADGQCSVPVVQTDFPASLRWSPDGKRIVFEAMGGIYALDIAAVLGEDFLRTGLVCP